MSSKLSGILFDLGDTLLDFGKVDVPGLFEQGARLAYDYLAELDQPLPGFARFHRRQYWAIRWSYVKSLVIRREFNALEVLGRLSMRMGHDLTAQQTVELAWRWYEPLSRTATVEPGTRRMLEDFASMGLTLGIVSNTFVPGEVLDRHLDQANLLDLLPVRVYSCNARFRKPSRNIFRLALEQANLDPGRTLFVGDSPAADIAGANRAGMISVLKDPADHHRRSKVQPAYRIRELSELRGIVSGLGQSV